MITTVLLNILASACRGRKLSLFILKRFIVLLFIFNLCVISNAHADKNSFGYRIFEIQKKQAIKGSTLAQYKLGTFYEYGISVKPNTKQAKAWYQKAAKKNNKPAIDRLLYLKIKQQGFNKTQHTKWLNKIINESRKGNVHSTILMGQLYHYNLGVEKDLNKARNLLRRASSNGHTEIDFEIQAISRELEKNNPVIEANETPETEVKAVNLETKPVAKKQTAKKTKSKPKSVKKTKSKKSAKKKSANNEIKRKNYERAMRKQYREQLILQQQQQWSEDEEWSDEEEGDGDDKTDE